MARVALIVSLLTALLALFGFFQWAWAEWKAHRVRKKITLLGIVAFTLLAPSIGHTTVYTAASCSQTDVVAAETLSTDGDTINIPAGTCTWAALLSISNKSVTIQGVGAGTEAQCAVGGQTIYTCINSTTAILTIVTHATGNSPAGYTALNGITFSSSGVSGCSVGSTHMVNISGTSTNVRVHHNNFYYAGNCSAFLSVDVIGVADHNLFFGHNNFQHAIIARHSSWLGVGLYGDNSWATPSTYGQIGNFFFEDNTFTTDDFSSVNAASDHFYGSRAVMRFNTLVNTQFGNHGTESGGRLRGYRHVEVYRNHVTWNAVSSTAVIYGRGGSGKFFDNTVTTTAPGSLTRAIDFNTLRAGPSNANPQYYPFGFCRQTAVTLTRSGSVATATTATEHGVHTSGSYIDIFGASDSNFNVSGVVGTRVSSTQFTYPVLDTGATADSGTTQGAFDANSDSVGYRCLDQFGAGPGLLISGDGPGSSAITPRGSLSQSLEPGIIFNNTLNTVLNAGEPTSFGGNVIVDNRDYFNQNAGCAGAGCAAGVGRGTVLPTGCTPVASGIGPYYWKTDDGSWNTSTTEAYSATPGQDGVLYRCVSSDIWALEYTPYIYPHPLVTSSDLVTESVSPIAVGRVLRWMEILLPILGLLSHARVRHALLTGCIATMSYTSIVYGTVMVAGSTITKQSTVRVLTVFNELTERRK